MRFDAFATLVVAVIALYVAPSVNAGWPSSMDKQERVELDTLVHSESLALPEDLPLIVKYKNKKGREYALSQARNNEFGKDLPLENIVTLYAQDKAALKALLKHKDIEYVEPDHRVVALHLRGPSKAVEGGQNARQLSEAIGYGINMVQAPLLWKTSPKEKMTICVVDSGYAMGHPDLPDLGDHVTGKSFVKGDWYTDIFGHGSHCAGVIGALGLNEEGIVGVIKDSSSFNFHVTKVLDDNGDGRDSDVLLALKNCIEVGAKVINMSLGGMKASETARVAYRMAYDAGVLVVAASGNAGNDAYSYPASYPHVISVAAVDDDMKVGGFSQYNAQVEIAGPGVDILSTVTINRGRAFGYDSWSGTSMATPYVAGVAALVWSRFPECSNNQIRNVLARTARDVGKIGCDEFMGYGIVQAKAAHDLLAKDGCEAGDDSPKPLSKGAVGGCLQDPMYTPPPTMAPTEFSCDQMVFVLELTTDKWGEETSWELRNSKKKTVASGDGYRSVQSYTEQVCLPQDAYTFTIRDSEEDGLCCEYGLGQYQVSFSGKLVKKGGAFEAMEKISFGKQESSGFGVKQVNAKPAVPLPTQISTASTAPPTTPPTGFPTRSPTDRPTTQPTLKPTRFPTSSPTTLPTHTPTGTPTSPPSQQPSLQPSTSPTLLPTTSPSLSPTKQPTTRPTAYPTLSPTSRPTLSPTKTPTALPTSFPTTKPSASPTLLPTPAPSVRPTMSPTLHPTMTPSFSPSEKPTSSPTSPPTDMFFYRPPPLVNKTYAPPEIIESETQSPTSPTTAAPTQTVTTRPTQKAKDAASCKDDASWVYTIGTGATKTCKYLRKNSSIRCDFLGTNEFKEEKLGYDACPVACNSCPRAGDQTTLQTPSSTPPKMPSSGAPTTSPTPLTSSKTAAPQRKPTASTFNIKNVAQTCEDQKSWTTTTFWGSKKDCDYLSKRPSVRCWLKGVNEQGKVEDGYTACPKACDSCSGKPKPATTPAPTPARTRGPSSDCHDNPDWYYKTSTGKRKRCDSLKHLPWLCATRGKDTTRKKTTGYQSCPVTCRSCPADATVHAASPNTNECKDDEFWSKTSDNGKKVDCQWIARVPEDRCRKKGINRDGKKADGYTACPLSCDKCPSDIEDIPGTQPESSPDAVVQAVSPSTNECIDDELWIKTNKNGKKLDCQWIARDPEDRCRKMGMNRDQKKTDAYTACPLSCDRCPDRQSGSDRVSN